MLRNEIDRIQRELGEEQSKLDSLRSQHAASQQAYATALSERRVLLFAHQMAREDKAAEADRKVREVEDRISTLAGVIAAQEARVAQVAAQLADVKQDKAREAEAHAVALERALGNLKPVMTEFANACRAAGAIVTEPMGIGRTMADILRQVENDTAYCAELLRQRARALRQEPPPAPPASKVTPKPELMPQPWRQSDLVERFVDLRARTATRIHAEANRARSWWQGQFRQSDLIERFVDWKTRAAARIHAEANRARSWWQGLFRQSGLVERFVDWKARAAARIHAEATRANSWWQRLLAWRWK